MVALFKVTFGTRKGGENFTSETVLAKDAAEAIRKATAKVGKELMRCEGGLVATDVRMLGMES